MTIKIAVMSDLHVGLAARSKDLCPVPPDTPKKNREKYDLKPDDSFRQNFVEFLQREEITADYLVLPGDVTNAGDPREVQLLPPLSFCKRLML